MTKIWVISDFQADINGIGGFFRPEHLPDADVLVVAGDFAPPLHNSIMALAKISFLMPVVYVPGNRDFYGRNIQDELALARKACTSPQGKGIHLLYNDAVVIGDTRFIGSTLWTDMKLEGGVTERGIEFLSDFAYIQTNGRPFTPSDYVTEHRLAVDFIEEELQEPFEGATVVVSHHSPHPNSITERHAANVAGVNAFFHSDLRHLLEGPAAPDMWVHGATHQSVDYVVGSTRVVSNPLGYLDRNENPSFDEQMVVDLAAMAHGIRR